MRSSSSRSPSDALDELLSEPVESAKQRARTTFDNDLREFGSRLVLFGAGNMGRRVLARLRRDALEPLAFADNRKADWGREIDGLHVLAPTEAIERYGDSATFIVTIYNNQHSFPETAASLASMGCRKVISVVPLRWKYHETFLPYFRDDLPYKVLQDREIIRDAFAVWSDELSRIEFTGQIAWRLHADYSGLTPPNASEEYFPPDLFRLTTDECAVDVGAYDGDTLRRFLRIRGSEFRRVVAIEPDPENFARLKRSLAGLPDDLAKRIEIHQVAAGAYGGRMRFAGGEGVASTLCDDGSIEVDCVKLDQLLDRLHPTYIKLDVEGAEYAAIEGCRQVLASERPVVAACVYHAQDHLWKIPLLLNKNYKSCKFFLRPHMPECWDTVCYAVPKERQL